MLPDLVSLNLFIRAVERRSISKAALESHIALAAASRRIAMLEHCYGVQLLYRSAQGVEPTAAGTSLLYHARRLLHRESLMKAEMSDFLNGIKGHIRLQANTSAITQFLPQELAVFSESFPEVKIELTESRSSLIIQALRDGNADLGIVMDGPSCEGITRFAYHQDTLVVVVPKGHEMTSKKVSFAETLKYDFVGLDGDTAIMGLLSAAAKELDEPLRLRVQVSSFEAVCKFVQAGIGIGVLPKLTAEEFGRGMGLRLIELDEDWTSREMYVCVRSINALSAPTKTLISHLIGTTDLDQTKID
ncbi:transcriptional regulator, LysR family [Ectothiorhodosinus mongolicus]|uniref:Transcriptional regulator, LysR family n=1 Tax=Ectothiorhodosinus mongolicus TaxID=233100 RepID=A0A1R3W7D6_9GAMM|nr:LysR family transcriptional regulator [Ectothiorhodosinus mongolicus]ULX57693.1 LysR family transcriptional regulator [Ectothiorhodosinus mongolicus]SIT73625.1 transcriptional regulator, LysR family [Ectothiorhodosinus mongolicus]